MISLTVRCCFCYDISVLGGQIIHLEMISRIRE